MLSSWEMDTVKRDQILDKVICISQNSDIFKKGMNPLVLPFAIIGLFTVLYVKTTWRRKTQNSKAVIFKL